MREGSLEAPTRHAIAWQDPDFTDMAKIEAEMHRVFDICHGCRRCFNLCDSFPRLFDLDRQFADRGARCVPIHGLQKRRRCLHALRHVLHDQMPVRSAARVQPRFSPSHAALPRGGAEGREDRPHRAGAGQDRPQRQARHGGGAARQLGDRHRQRPDPAAAREGDRHRPRRRAAEIPRPHLHDARQARVPELNRSAPAFRPQGGALRHLLRQLSQPEDRRRRARRAGAQRRRDRNRLSRLLRHAAARARRYRAGRGERKQGLGRARAVDREGLRRYRPGAVLRADAEIRMAADPAGRRGREAARAGDVRRERVHRRHRAQGGVCAWPRRAARRCHPAPRLPCPRPEYRSEGGGDAAPRARRQGRGHRALLRARRVVGRRQGQFRDRAQDRQAGGAPGGEERDDVRVLGMPARRHAYRAGHGASRRRGAEDRDGAAPDRALCAGLWPCGDVHRGDDIWRSAC